jgi:phage/plasmid-associated DNA primase
MIALRRLLDSNSIFVREKTIEQRRERYVLATNPIEAFLKDAVCENSESDIVTKEIFYQAYRSFCNENKLAIQSKESLGKSLKNMNNFKEGRESSRERGTYWRGVKLTENFNFELK